MSPLEIGKSIRERRLSLGIDQSTLAALAGVSINTVVAVERGTGNPSLRTLSSILVVLGLHIEVRL